MKRISNLFVGTVAGFGLGIPCAFIQADRMKIGGQVIPYGAVLALALIVVAQLWLARSSQSRLSAIGLALGWVLSTVFLAGPTGTFEPIIFKSWWSNVYVIGGAIVIGFTSTLRPLRQIENSEELPVPFTDGMKTQLNDDQKASQD